MKKLSEKQPVYIFHFSINIILSAFLCIKGPLFPSRKKPSKRGGRYYIWRLICGKTSKKKQGINSETHRLPDKGQRVGEHCSPNPHINNCVLASICSDSLTHAHMMSKICMLSTLTGTWLCSVYAFFLANTHKKCNISLNSWNVKKGWFLRCQIKLLYVVMTLYFIHFHLVL